MMFKEIYLNILFHNFQEGPVLFLNNIGWGRSRQCWRAGTGAQFPGVTSQGRGGTGT